MLLWSNETTLWSFQFSFAGIIFDIKMFIFLAALFVVKIAKNADFSVLWNYKFILSLFPSKR